MRLNPDERVLLDLTPSPYWTSGRYVPTLGLWEIWRRHHHFILTNERVLVVKGILNRSEQSVPLGRVQDVNLRLPWAAGKHVLLTTAGGNPGVQWIGPLSRLRARVYADTVQRAIPKLADGVASP